MLNKDDVGCTMNKTVSSFSVKGYAPMCAHEVGEPFVMASSL
jgi:hypothetical protein